MNTLNLIHLVLLNQEMILQPYTLSPDSPPIQPKRIPKWERRLPRRYVLAATPSERSLNLDVAIQTTDTGDVHAVSALLDSGANGAVQ